MAGKLCSVILLSAASVLALARNSSAQAAEPLTVERAPGAEECPDAPTLIARIAKIRGRAGAPITASYDVSFTHTADSFTAIIHTGPTGESQRVLEGRGLTCAALAQATAVTLALLFDSEVDSAQREPPKREPAPLSATPKAERPRLEPIWIEPSARGSRVDGTFALGIAGLIGVLRPLSPAVSGELGLQVARWRVGIGVLWNPSQTLTLEPGVVRESLLGGTVRSCFALTRANGFRFDLCSGLFAGIETAQAEGFTRNDRETRSWLAIPLEVSFAQLTGPIGWEVSASALGSLVHQDFAIDNLGPAYQSPRVGGMLSLRGVGLLPL